MKIDKKQFKLIWIIIIVLITLCLYLDAINWRNIINEDWKQILNVTNFNVLKIDFKIWGNIFLIPVTVFFTYYFTQISNKKLTEEQRYIEPLKDVSLIRSIYENIKRSEEHGIIDNWENYFLIVPIPRKYYNYIKFENEKNIINDYLKHNKYPKNMKLSMDTISLRALPDSFIFNKYETLSNNYTDYHVIVQKNFRIDVSEEDIYNYFSLPIKTLNYISILKYLNNVENLEDVRNKLRTIYQVFGWSEQELENNQSVYNCLYNAIKYIIGQKKILESKYNNIIEILSSDKGDRRQLLINNCNEIYDILIEQKLNSIFILLKKSIITVSKLENNKEYNFYLVDTVETLFDVPSDGFLFVNRKFIEVYEKIF